MEYFSSLYELRNKNIDAKTFFQQVEENMKKHSKSISLNGRKIKDVKVEIGNNEPGSNVVKAELAVELEKGEIPFQKQQNCKEMIYAYLTEVNSFIDVTPDLNRFIHREYYEQKGTTCGMARTNISFYSKPAEFLDNEPFTNLEILTDYCKGLLDEKHKYFQFNKPQRDPKFVLCIERYNLKDDTFLSRYFNRIENRSPWCISYPSVRYIYLIPGIVFIDCALPGIVWLFYYFSTRIRDQLFLPTLRESEFWFYRDSLIGRKKLIMQKFKSGLGRLRKEFIHDKLIISDTKKNYLTPIKIKEGGKLLTGFSESGTVINAKIMKSRVSKNDRRYSDVLFIFDKLADKIVTTVDMAYNQLRCTKSVRPSSELVKSQDRLYSFIPFDIPSHWYILSTNPERKDGSYIMFVNKFTRILEKFMDIYSASKEVKVAVIINKDYEYVFKDKATITKPEFPFATGMSINFATAVLHEKICNQEIRVTLYDGITVSSGVIILY